MKKNVASQKIGVQMITAADGTAFTGSVTVAVCGDAGTQATGSVGSGSCTHEGGGYHTYAPSQAETNYDLIAFTFSGTGAISATVQVFTIPATGLLAPTTAGRTLDVSATGEAGVDWANVGSPTTAVNLSGTTVGTTTTNTDMRGTDSAALAATALSTSTWTGTLATNLGTTNTSVTAIKAKTDNLPASPASTTNITAASGVALTSAYDAAKTAAQAGDEMDIVDAPNSTAITAIQSGLATPTNITAGTITTVTNLTNAPMTGDFTSTMKTSIGTAVDASSTATSVGAIDTNVDTLVARLTSARAGYLDNLNVGGAVASQADINAINQSASKHILLTTVGQYERPESGSTVYTVEARTFAADTGLAVDADSTPTLTATGTTTGSLAANLGTASTPATGVYRWDYTVAYDATTEPIRFDISAAIDSSMFTLSAYTQVVDLVSTTWTSTDATHLTAIYNKLPTGDMVDAAAVNSEVDTALADYDGPTNAEMVARTLLAADYFDPSADTVAHVTLVDTTTTNTDMRGTDSAYTGTPPTTGEIADAVLDEATSGHTTAGTLGKAVIDVLSDTNELQGNQSNWATATGFSTFDVSTDGVKLHATQSDYAPAKVGDAMALTSGERDATAAALLDLADGVETSVTLRQSLRAMAAALAGKRSNSGTSSEQYDAIGNAGTSRIQPNADASGDGTPTLNL